MSGVMRSSDRLSTNMLAQIPGADHPPAPPRYSPARGGSFLEVDFDETPFTLAWEITRACALACLHCRAEALPFRDPRELTTDEGLRLIDQVVELGCPILVVTGGDPLMRPDVYEFLGYAVNRNLRVALSPSATGRLTRVALERARAAGTHMLHLSLDGSTAEIHDAFRRVRGSYQRTLDGLRMAAELGFVLQVGTTVSRHNPADLERIAEIVAELGVDVWTVFFLVPTGRAHIVAAVLAGLRNVPGIREVPIATRVACPKWRSWSLCRILDRKEPGCQPHSASRCAS
jgi:MoaA/NifB/PqqE/SkfB family radical SAM enzyme